MIILEEKMPGVPPPPPYSPGRDAAPPPFPHNSRATPVLGTLPSHLLLRIVYLTFTNGSSLEKQRKTLYWLTVSLRLVNRAFYVACMHVLRSTYIPSYASLVHPPYTSDPFPLQSSALYTAPKPADAPIQIRSLQRETQVLDLFIALKVREDVWLDETELHLERDESFRDLFDLNQPRARTEDLVRVYGMREGLISADGRRPTNGPSGSRSRQKTVPFDALSVTFSSRRLGLVLTTRERKRTVVEVQRTKDESLEAGAKRLVREMKLWLSGA
ncbi:hypothetical protein PsYK624_118040 [Phanerochaete sordida]|uniref:Uncharacterized protein n=1 Tax=Phanerochaete sordida TaxID=48140 RepID=A0A9P3GIM7_9APHY|nr:hypothetical protein PsYK624_118040 [Phanerochaete sordida]